MDKKIFEIETALGIDDGRFEQKGTIELVKNPFGGVWTDIYNTQGATGNSTHIFSCLANMSLKDGILSGQDWLKYSDSFAPCLSESGKETWYSNGQDEGYEYLVATQYFHPLEEQQIIINPEFVLLLALYRDSDGSYYEVDECGGKKKVVEVNKDRIRIRTKHLMKYIAAKQMLFVQFVDSRVSTSGNYPHNAEIIGSYVNQGDAFSYLISYVTNPEHNYLFSMIHARSIVEPQPIENCGLWPYEEEESYPEFIIKELPDGTYERFTCNPSKLANFFGGNPEAPHYLTPIYFKPSVLDKYRKDPHFTVSEYRLECGSQWGVDIDNVDSSRVMVFLGDLGRNIPSSERVHFLSNEIPPSDQRISEDVLMTSLFGIWIEESSGPVSKFFNAYKNLGSSWKKRFGWNLFRTFHAEDQNIANKIRIPTSDSPEEFETVVLNLAKLLVDYIDESRLQNAEKKGSINKLEAFLENEGIQVDLRPLRNLYSLRSDSIAHAKGRNYDKLKNRIGFVGNAVDDAKALIDALTNFMKAFTQELDKPPSDTTE